LKSICCSSTSAYFELDEEDEPVPRDTDGSPALGGEQKGEQHNDLLQLAKANGCHGMKLPQGRAIAGYWQVSAEIYLRCTCRGVARQRAVTMLLALSACVWTANKTGRGITRNRAFGCRGA
jgi:hypothetical protein